MLHCRIVECTKYSWLFCAQIGCLQKLYIFLTLYLFVCCDLSCTKWLPKQLKLSDYIMDMECVLCEVGIVFVCVLNTPYIHIGCSSQGIPNFRMLSYESFWVKILCQHMPLYQILCCYKHFKVLRFWTLSVVSSLINHLHAYFYT